MSVLLASEAAGTAKAETVAGTDGEWRELAVPGSNGKLTIVGNWGAAIPTCTSSDMHFDGRDGPGLGTINPGDVGRQFTQALSFAYCNDDAPRGFTRLKRQFVLLPDRTTMMYLYPDILFYPNRRYIRLQTEVYNER